MVYMSSTEQPFSSGQDTRPLGNQPGEADSTLPPQDGIDGVAPLNPDSSCPSHPTDALETNDAGRERSSMGNATRNENIEAIDTKNKAHRTFTDNKKDVCVLFADLVESTAYK